MKNAIDVNRLKLVALIAVLVTLLLIRVFLIPYWATGALPDFTEVAANTINHLLGAAFAALGISLLLLWLLPKDGTQIEEAIVIQSRDISDELKAAARSASEWNYRGHTGRYFRTVILPILENGVMEQGRHLNIFVELLDPNNASAIEFFVRYRQSVNRDNGSYWTIERAKAEIIATIVALSRVSRDYPRISCSIFLGNTVSPFSVDCTDSAVILTRESSRMAALKHPARSSFFLSMQEGLYLSRQQARMVPVLPPMPRLADTLDGLGESLKALGIQGFDARSLLEAVDNALKNPVNPYPNA